MFSVVFEILCQVFLVVCQLDHGYEFACVPLSILVIYVKISVEVPGRFSLVRPCFFVMATRKYSFSDIFPLLLVSVSGCS